MSDPVVNAHDPYVEIASGGLLAVIGEVDQARRSVRQVTAAGISIAHDAEYLGALWPLVDGVIELNERDAAGIVYDALEPYAHCWVIGGIRAGCAGRSPTSSDGWWATSVATRRLGGTSRLP